MSTEERKKIGTHSGSFHCDEALACYLLTKLTPGWKDAEIIRTRDAKVLATLPLLVDVGGVYDPSTGRFDHHQRGFTETFDEEHSTVKLSSAGLVYKHFGLQIISSLTDLSEEDTKLVWIKVYENFIEALDGIDNGVPQYPSDVKAAYKSSTGLSARVGRLNPAWNEKGIDIQDRFRQAMEMAGADFLSEVKGVSKVWMPARAIVQAALGNRHSVHESGEIIQLETPTVWPSHIHSLEEEMKIETPVKYVLYEDSAKKWRVQAVAIAPGSFVSRLALPEPWRGVRDQALSDLTGIPGGIFIHANGFIGGNATLEGAKAMAALALSGV